MATPDSRPAFRLPWQSAPDAEETSEQAASSAVEPPAWPHHDLIRRIGVVETIPPAESPAKSPARPQAAPPAVATPPAGATPGTASANGAVPAHRRPTKFLADLTRAMRQAADESRDATLAQCQADVTSHIEAARAQAETAAGDARRRADEDAAALGEWSKVEMARIERETEVNAAARRVGLETELNEQQARLELELERVADQARSFEREMETFFVQLLHEEDPSAFAALAAQLPDPPVFEPWRPDMDPTAADAPQPPAPEIHGTGTRASGSKKARAAAEAPSDAVGPPTELSADEVEARIGSSTGAMPAMRPDDFAAAEAEAAHWALEVPAAPESGHAPDGTAHDESKPGHGTAAGSPAAHAQEPVAWPRAGTPGADPAGGIRTQISVTGLVSVASIATFKRLISRVQGVSAIQVTSGPEGEFLFAVAHEERVDLAAAILKLQGFDAQIVKSGDGIINVVANDPEIA